MVNSVGNNKLKIDSNKYLLSNKNKENPIKIICNNAIKIEIPMLLHYSTESGAESDSDAYNNVYDMKYGLDEVGSELYKNCFVNKRKNVRSNRSNKGDRINNKKLNMERNDSYEIVSIKSEKDVINFLKNSSFLSVDEGQLEKKTKENNVSFNDINEETEESAFPRRINQVKNMTIINCNIRAKNVQFYTKKLH